MKQSALSTTARTHDAQKLARRHVQADMVHRFDTGGSPAVDVVEIFSTYGDALLRPQVLLIHTWSM
jgi:hypothetical protein